MTRNSPATPTRSERATGALVQLAPLTGIGVWIWQVHARESDSSFYYVFFFPGLFMLGTGLAVALLARFAARSAFVRSQAAGSLRFHWIGACVAIAIVVLVLLSTLLDRQPLSLDNQPKYLEAGFAIAAFAFGALLPLIETARAFACGISAWKAA
jgi:hypothetical protein